MARGAAPQSRQPGLVEPGPARHVERSWVDAPLRRAAPDRIRRQPAGHTRLPPTALEDGGASGVRHVPGHRDHHGPVGPGPREWRRHGARRVAARERVQSRGAPGGGPPHLGTRRGRMHDGGRHPRSRGTRRDAAARQAHLRLRRQRHLDRRRDPPLAHGRRRGPVRGLRLACHPRRGRPRCRERAAGASGGGRRNRPADVDLLPDDHRIRCAGQAGNGGGTRSGAWRGRSRGRPPAAQLGLSALRDSARRLSGLGHAGPGCGRRGELAGAPRALSGGLPRARGGVRAAHAG